MTRINVVPPSELSNPHLIVEMKEITRVYPLSWKALQKGLDPSSFPNRYVLGTGHVMFFYTRLGYIDKRQKALCEEMTRRGYVIPREKQHPWIGRKKDESGRITIAAWPESWLQDWEPTEEAMALNRDRIAERMAAINSWK